MVAPTRSRRAKNANKKEAPKRKALNDRSNVKASPKEKKGKRKSLEVGQDCRVYIQEKKDRSGILHPATKDKKTGGYYFTPKDARTPIAYDGRRHKLVKKPKKTPPKIKERLITAFDSEERKEVVDNDSEEEEQPKEEEQGGKRKRRGASRVNYKESDNEEAAEESSVEEPVKRARRKKQTKTTERKKIEEDTDVESDAPPAPKPRRESFEGGGDWRTGSVIDY